MYFILIVGAAVTAASWLAGFTFGVLIGGIFLGHVATELLNKGDSNE